MSIRVFGIRHHGPGSARKLEQALAGMEPDIILIEGPPEGEGLLSWAPSPDLEPPAAMLIYRPDHFEQAAYVPFASFSPEWRAIRYATGKGIPVRFIDLPLAWQWSKPADRTSGAYSLDPMAEIAMAAGYEDGEKWWEEVIEQQAGTEDEPQSN